jgi:hypothetical protein
MRMRLHISGIFVSILAIVLIGCGEKSGRDYKIDPAQQATISGTVKYGTKNLPLNAMVTFFNPDEGIAAVGFVDASGNFTLTPAEKETGLPAGKYLVTVTPPPPKQLTEEQYKKMEANAMAMPTIVYPELPTKFYNSLTSGLAFEVKPGVNTFDIDLAK